MTELVIVWTYTFRIRVSVEKDAFAFMAGPPIPLMGTGLGRTVWQRKYESCGAMHAPISRAVAFTRLAFEEHGLAFSAGHPFCLMSGILRNAVRWLEGKALRVGHMNAAVSGTFAVGSVGCKEQHGAFNAVAPPRLMSGVLLPAMG